MALLVRDDRAADAPFGQPVAAVAAQFSTDTLRGLASAEAQARLGRYGPNELAAVPPTPAWRRFPRRLKYNPCC